MVDVRDWEPMRTLKEVSATELHENGIRVDAGRGIQPRGTGVLGSFRTLLKNRENSPYLQLVSRRIFQGRFRVIMTDSGMRAGKAIMIW